MTDKKDLAVIPKNEIVKETPILDKLLVAAQNGMPIDVLERFMDLAERNQKREAEQAYHRAFALFKANPPKIVKDKLVNYQSKDGKLSLIHISEPTRH